MRLPAQLRSWTARATRREQVLTWGALAALVGLFATSMALQPASQSIVASGEGGRSDVAVPDGPGVGLPEDLAAGESAPEMTLPADEGGGPPRSDHESGVAGPADPAAPAGPTDQGQTARPPVELTASDRGVTADSVTVGFMLQNPAGLNNTGFSTGQRTDGARYVEALAEWASRDGGVGGRRIVPVLRLTDPTSVEDQAAACRAMVDDAKVFGVVDVAAMLDTAAQDCLANRTKGDTPFVHSIMWSRDWQARSGGNEVSYQAAIDRISRTWARDLGAMSWFPGGATVGILGDKCPATQPTIVDVLGPALEEAGAGRVVFGNHDCNLESVVAEPPNIATRFRLDRVTHVLIATNFAAAQIFMSTAASQGYSPEYSVSDWFQNTSDATTANFPTGQFDGAVGIASLGTMLRPSGKEPYPGWESCSQIAVDAGLDPIPPDQPRSAELLALCDNFMLFLAALDAAGPNPTRELWRVGITTLGQRTSAVFGPSRFEPGKLTGSDTVHTVRWSGGCRCWRSVSELRPAAD